MLFNECIEIILDFLYCNLKRHGAKVLEPESYMQKKCQTSPSSVVNVGSDLGQSWFSSGLTLVGDPIVDRVRSSE